MSSHTTTIQFYHLTATPIERALPKLVEKAYSAGHRVLLVDSIPERLEMFNQVLWTYSTLTFLPHGTVAEGNPEEQPILLSSVIPAPASAGVNSGGIQASNNADVLITTDGSQPDSTAAFTRIIDIFDGNDAEAVKKARTRWAGYKANEHKLMYFKQNDAGGWEEKQVA